MATGTLKWFNSEKGFGFITCDNGGEEIFANHTEFKIDTFNNVVKDGQRVSFEIKRDPKGAGMATNIKAL
ncbi:cold-shock protein [Bacillus mycoides]|uniref:cold-shock protein n=1 Tax=Bacillus mycoides TaxID=1405 RepID=UPI002E1C32E4|nr:cold shock domain-containing protein [Bacillus mycoides]MED1011341.1 cold shock domain-containing protein [Bacillus mycoides]MED1050010.1 cold shock domain-containing protein [Bacillus mycoides]